MAMKFNNKANKFEAGGDKPDKFTLDEKLQAINSLDRALEIINGTERFFFKAKDLPLHSLQTDVKNAIRKLRQAVDRAPMR